MNCLMNQVSTIMRTMMLCSLALVAQAQGAKYTKQVAALFEQRPCLYDAPRLITDYEWHELSMRHYLSLCRPALTSFGHWGLRYITEPIADLGRLKERQAALVYLDQNQPMQQLIIDLLGRIAAHEESVLSYFDARNDFNTRVQGLYYPKYWLTSWLNKYELALDFSSICVWTSAVYGLASALLLDGAAQEFVSAYKKGEPFSFKKAVTNLITRHSIKRSLSADLPEDYFVDQHQAIEKLTSGVAIGIAGTFGDKAFYFKEGMLKSPLQNTIGYVVSAKAVDAIAHAGGMLIAGGQLIYADVDHIKRIRGQVKNIQFQYQLQRKLYEQLVAVADCVRSAHQLLECAQELPYFADHSLVFELVQTCAQQESALSQIMTMCQQDTFSAYQDVWYSRGKVLLAHQKMLALKDALVPLLQLVGLLDGFMSIVQLYQDHKDSVNEPWALVSFIDADRPTLTINDGYVPHIAQRSRVFNDCQLAVVRAQQNLLLTGPSGGGKSTYLKMVGGAVACAQAWTIAPARTMTITPLAHMRTSFDPQEDINKGVSTFMAQQQRLAYVQQVAQAAQAGETVLLLIDEPYRGTIELEAERRASQLGAAIANNPYVMSIMSCHLREPIALATTTDCWHNVHMVIEPLSNGSFNCLYRIQDGPAWWWFDDVTQRMRYVDWLLTQRHA